MELLSFVETALVFVVSVYHCRCVVLLNRKSLGRVVVEDLRFVWKFKKYSRTQSTVKSSLLSPRPEALL